MEISYRDKSEQKLYEILIDKKKCQSIYGDNTKKIQQRLNELLAAETLEECRKLPGRCEELKENRRGQLSVRLNKNWRLIFKPNHPRDEIYIGNQLIWRNVTVIIIIEIVDYH